MGIAVSPEVAGALVALLDRISLEPQNLTSIEILGEGIDRHLADSLAGLAVPELAGASACVDLGSGGGFPGLALAAARPEMAVTLVESERRKADWLRRAAEHFPNVRVVADRSEHLASAEREAYPARHGPRPRPAAGDAGVGGPAGVGGRGGPGVARRAVGPGGGGRRPARRSRARPRAGRCPSEHAVPGGPPPPPALPQGGPHAERGSRGAPAAPPGARWAGPDRVIYAVANQKGGVGKTTTAVNLAACLAEAGARVLLVDRRPPGQRHRRARHQRAGAPDDGRGAARRPSRGGGRGGDGGHQPRPGALVPDLARAAVELPGRAGRERLLATALAPARASYGYVFLDCPPSLDLITINALAAADRLIVPVQCEYYALEGLSRLMETVAAVQEHINPGLRVTGMLMTMHDVRTRVSGDVIGEVRKHFPELAFHTVVPRNVRLAEAPSYGEPVIRYDPHCAGADAYFEAAKEVAARG